MYRQQKTTTEKFYIQKQLSNSRVVTVKVPEMATDVSWKETTVKLKIVFI